MSTTARLRAAVIGHPVAHSLSPVLHQAAYADLGLSDWVYERHDVVPQDLPAFLDQLRRSRPGEPAWAGLSVTMPHKQHLAPSLDVIDPLAQVVGSVNTVVVQGSAGSGLLAGVNTDVAGIVGAVTEVRGTAPALASARALVLGSGATACSALAALTQLGATHLTVAARRHAGPGRAATAAHRMGLEVETVTWHPGQAQSDEMVAELMTDVDYVVSTVPAGVADSLAQPLRALAAARGGHGVLLDVVYDPWPTALASAWQERGGAIAPGWLMLLHQAVDQVRLMTGRQPSVSVMRDALTTALATR